MVVEEGEGEGEGEEEVEEANLERRVGRMLVREETEERAWTPWASSLVNWAMVMLSS